MEKYNQVKTFDLILKRQLLLLLFVFVIIIIFLFL